MLRKIEKEFSEGYNRDKTIWRFIAIIFMIAFAIIPPVINIYQAWNQKESQELSISIQTVSTDLKNSITELNQIQSELEQRIEFVNNLKKEVEIAESMIDLSKEQVDAIRATLGQELNKNSAKDFWVAFANNFFFMVLGKR